MSDRSDVHDLYEILGVSIGASDEDIRKSYLKLSLQVLVEPQNCTNAAVSS